VQGPVLNVFNKRHSGKRIKVEWGISGLKMKWPILKSTLTMRRRSFTVIFEACCKMTNFIYRRRRRMTMFDSGNANDGAWDSDA
jgi:DDE superfamily endonuclease